MTGAKFPARYGCLFESSLLRPVLDISNGGRYSHQTGVWRNLRGVIAISFWFDRHVVLGMTVF